MYEVNLTDGLLDGAGKVVHIDGFGCEVEGTVVHCQADILQVTVGTHHDDALSRVLHLIHLGQHGQAIHLRHIDIAEDNVDVGMVIQHSESLHTSACEEELIFATADLPSEILLHQEFDLFLVVNAQYLSYSHRSFINRRLLIGTSKPFQSFFALLGKPLHVTFLNLLEFLVVYLIALLVPGFCLFFAGFLDLLDVFVALTLSELGKLCVVFGRDGFHLSLILLIERFRTVLQHVIAVIIYLRHSHIDIMYIMHIRIVLIGRDIHLHRLHLLLELRVIHKNGLSQCGNITVVVRIHLEAEFIFLSYL